MKTGKIARPDWLDCAIPRIKSSIGLYQSGRLPESIEIFMVATPLKYALRGIYGKDNRGVAWELFKEAWREYFAGLYWDFRFKVGWLNDDMREAVKDVEDDDETRETVAD